MTREELITQLAKRHNIPAQLVDPEPGFAGVNIWTRDDQGIAHPTPATTVWWPKLADEDPHGYAADYAWGDSFEHRAAPDLTAVELADKIAETLEELTP